MTSNPIFKTQERKKEKTADTSTLKIVLGEGHWIANYKLYFQSLLEDIHCSSPVIRDGMFDVNFSLNIIYLLVYLYEKGKRQKENTRSQRI